MAYLAFSSSLLPDNYNCLVFFTAIAVPLLSILVLLLLNKNNKNKTKALNLPPGPPGWPVVGNLFQVARSGKPFIHYVRDLIGIYGPIFTLRMGARTLIIISSAELAHEALIEKGQMFASRPAENPTRNIFSCDKFTVNSAVYGPEWRSLRRNMVSGMLSNSRLREFRGVRKSAMERFIQRIRNEAEANDGAVWVLKNARFAVFCILLSMCFGVDLDEETIIKIDQVMKRVLITLNPRMDDYLPLLRPFFSKQQKEALVVRAEQIQTLVPLIDMRRQILRSPSKDPNAMSFSYLDTLLDLKVDGRKSTPDDVELVTLCSEFLNGGTDTTATAIEWAIARLIENPLIQTKLYQEIVSEVGERPVDEKDTEKMVYLQAFVKELLRKHPPTFFSLTHAAAEPGAKLGGYDIPMGTNLEIYLPTISEDPKLWSNEETFDPERFLSGGESADITGVTGIKMIPFGCGRRICPGLGMGVTHITLMVARMVQEFEWCVHPSQPNLEFADKQEFTVVMNSALLAMVKSRQ
ncbi:Cytochrome P450 E-class group I protein [Dioscorea alata]|uniref:Cytochrome P450 E-class group I protein n=1 Tax=Dioscorea alata TaxID=55571 RepID=A0ACB7VZC2_DIOAL|nr:Cytochrome P450 E-class group I protein [Dioscorea alata]